MKLHPLRKILLSVCTGFLFPAAGITQYWQQTVKYRIDVSLNDKENTLDGFSAIEYINHSPDTLRFIWFHLWPNAYKNDRTSFSEQMLRNGNTRFYFSEKEDRGYINRLDFKVNNTTATVEDHPQYIDVVKIVLPEPLVPGGQALITTPFHVQLPYNFSRGGHVGQSYQVTQWYPKPAVYDRNGWHPMPYLDQGEFYSEFGSFDVAITLPANYAVAATGVLQDEQEKAWLRERSSFTWEPIVHSYKTKGGTLHKEVQEFPVSDARTKTLHYTQDHVHDFAWFADKRFIVRQDTLQMPSGRIVDLSCYYTPQEAVTWESGCAYLKNALRFYSKAIGPYPYAVASAVQGPESGGGGMEYLTITVIAPVRSGKLLDRVIAHEAGHNWFYGALGTNERANPWLDEGFNSYFEQRYMKQQYGDSAQLERILFETLASKKKDQPITTPAAGFSKTNYALVAYYKTAAWLDWVEATIGRDEVDQVFQTYYTEWKFRHPQPEDFISLLQEKGGSAVTPLVSALNQTGILPGMERQGTKTRTVFSKKYSALLLRGKQQNLVTIGPAMGANLYDKLMIGGFVTNATLPPNRLLFLAAPMYAFGSKRINGLAKLNYTFFPEKRFQRVDVFLNAAHFANDAFTDEDGRKNLFFFRKLVPGFRLTLKEQDPASTRERFFQWKTFLLGEDGLQFYRDTTISQGDTSISTRYRRTKTHYYINQARVVVADYRALYPYSGELRLDQGKDFIRTTFTGTYFFNYPKKGGLDLRLFAGKFMYLGEKTVTKQFRNDRFHLNMTGPNGYEDYTYSDYFIGRNEFEGLASQQIMERDGAFKVRSDLLASKIGKTDDWLIAANFSSTIPDGINPLRVLPVHIPVKVFADIGTYAEAWEPNTERDRFLFDAGLQFSFFRNTLNIYVPLLYSRVFRDYIRSTLPQKNRLLRTISFSINVSQFNLKKINRDFSL